MAIVAIASIAGHHGLFLGQLMLHAPNYDALHPDNLPFVVHVEPSKAKRGSVITR